MGVDGKKFKNALGRFASGVTVVTVHTQDGDYGMTASAFSSLSLDPPLVLVCVKNDSTTAERLNTRVGFSINVLSEGQKHLSNRYAGYGQQGQDYCEDLGDSRGEVSGAKFIEGALASLDCSFHEALAGGDHTIFIGEVQNVALGPDGTSLAPLLYFSGEYRGAGQRL